MRKKSGKEFNEYMEEFMDVRERVEKSVSEAKRKTKKIALAENVLGLIIEPDTYTENWETTRNLLDECLKEYADKRQFDDIIILMGLTAYMVFVRNDLDNLQEE